MGQTSIGSESTSTPDGASQENRDRTAPLGDPTSNFPQVDQGLGSAWVNYWGTRPAQRVWQGRFRAGRVAGGRGRARISSRSTPPQIALGANLGQVDLQKICLGPAFAEVESLPRFIRAEIRGGRVARTLAGRKFGGGRVARTLAGRKFGGGRVARTLAGRKFRGGRVARTLAGRKFGGGRVAATVRGPNLGRRSCPIQPRPRRSVAPRGRGHTRGSRGRRRCSSPRAARTARLASRARRRRSGRRA
ncbi:hypothetical protein ENSA5_08380 [Enhygromyxa salina]|uniref:Uncharacterized protein n=1 Tax=Enhygromyxa salina TaxID=215803 RepID=A0A2S9YGY0_9BACT|nr:hypothetical protein ENSA5_08380 [Enhygromyxa salina]